MHQKDEGLRVAIAICILCLFCVVGTILWISFNLSGSADGPLNILVLGLIFLSGIGGLIAGILFGRSIVIKTNPSLGIKVVIYLLIPVASIFAFLGVTILLFQIIGSIEYIIKYG